MALDFPDIDPVAFFVGPLPVRWYALAYLCGFLLGWKYVLMLIKGQKEGERPDPADIDDFMAWAIVGVILGGRLGYILFYNFPFYMHNPLKILYLMEGGMSFHGGAAGVIAAMLLFSKIKNVPFLRLADLVCCAVPIGLFFGRIANFVNGELYGRMSDVPWAVKFPAGDFLPRHPSQLYEAGLEGLALFLILLGLYRVKFVRETPGIVSAAFLIGYGVFRIFIELFREPDAQLGFIFSHISMGQVLSLPMILFALGLLVYVTRKDSHATY